MLVAGIKKRLTIWEIIISEQHWYQLIQLHREKVFRFSGNRFLNQVYTLILHTEHLYGIVKRQ